MIENIIDIAFVTGVFTGLPGMILLLSSYIDKGHVQNRRDNGWALVISGGSFVLISSIAEKFFQIEKLTTAAMLCLLLVIAITIAIKGGILVGSYFLDRKEPEFKEHYQERYSEELNHYGLFILITNIAIGTILDHVI